MSLIVRGQVLQVEVTCLGTFSLLGSHLPAGHQQDGQPPFYLDVCEMSRRRGQLELALRTTFPKRNLKDRLPSPRPKGRRSQGRGRGDLTEEGKSVPYQGRSVPYHMGSYTMGQLEGINFYGQYTCISYPLSILINGSSINMHKWLLEVPAAFPGHIPVSSHMPPSSLLVFLDPPLPSLLWSSDSIHHPMGEGMRLLHPEAPSRRALCTCHGKVKATVNILSREQ